jgi:hypothetical protein
MRRYLLVLPLLIACAKAETPSADSVAAASGPPALTEADVAGTWTGTGTSEPPDTGTVTFTITCGGGTCRQVVSSAPNDTVVSTYVLAADSSTGTSSPYKDPLAGGATVVDHWVARISGNQLTGNGWLTLADKPDSVVARYRFTGTKSP